MIKYPYPEGWHPVRFVLHWEDAHTVAALVEALQAARLRDQKHEENEQCLHSMETPPAS